jgi:hypothetical protein
VGADTALGAVSRLGAWEQAHWSLTLYPGAGEAGGCFVSARPRSGGVGTRGAAGDPARARAEAVRRARGKVRRYCASNRLNRLGTLTYGPPFCTDLALVKSDVALFFRNLRDGLGGKPFPYLWVPELHADGRRFHVHFAAGRFIKRGLIDSAWGHGFVHIKLLGNLPVGSGTWGESRLAARYLSKYVGKAFEHSETFGRHRYEVAQGFQPRGQVVRGPSRDGVISKASAVMGSRPSQVWTSDEVQDWKAPPSLWVAW